MRFPSCFHSRVAAAWLACFLSLPMLPAQSRSAITQVLAAQAGMTQAGLTNEAVMRLVAAGLPEASILQMIQLAPGQFSLDAKSVAQLSARKVSATVISAMLMKQGASAASTAGQPVLDPGPLAMEPVLAATEPVQVQIRQGKAAPVSLLDHPQKSIFVKSPAANARAAVANVLLSDVGLNLVTMALTSQMGGMWNPYMNDGIRKAMNLGQGLLSGHGVDTKGFEFDTLPNLSAETTLTKEPAEFTVPLAKYVASANTDLATLQPVLLKLEVREKDKSRLLSSRQVVLKQSKTGRFDMKPTTEREEGKVEQNTVPTTVERLPGSVLRIKTEAPLERGEYALVMRKASADGVYTANVALRPTASADAALEGNPFGMLAGSMPAAQPASPFGMFGRGGRTAAAAAPAQGSDMAGFLAWDFRVLD